MPTNIDTGLTIQDAVAVDHSPHIFTMSNGDLVVFYYTGSNFVYRSKSGGAWSAATTITPIATGDAPLQRSYLTRHGDVIYIMVSCDPIVSTAHADWFELTYNTSTHVFAVTNSTSDAGDGNAVASGIDFSTQSTNVAVLSSLHSNAAGSFGSAQELTATLGITGATIDQATTLNNYTSGQRVGVISDGTTTLYLVYGNAPTGTAFAVERYNQGTAADNVETPPAPAANPVGVTAVYDGTNFVFVINENNAKLRALTRTGTNTYGSWTDILSDASLVGQPAVCKKANGDLALFYRTNKNQANGEIWVVQRTSGTWGSPALLAGGAATGWSNPSTALNDVNDSGIARVVYVMGTASTWTLVEDSYTFTVAAAPPAAPTGAAAHGQWPNAPTRTLTRSSLWPKAHNITGINETDAAYGYQTEFYGEPAARLPLPAHGQWPMAPVRTLTRSALWTKSPGYNAIVAGINENDLTRGLVDQFYGVLDTYGVQLAPQIAMAATTLVAESAQVVTPVSTVIVAAQTALATAGAQLVDPSMPVVAQSSLVENTAQVVDPAVAVQASSALVETFAQLSAPAAIQSNSLITESAQLVDPTIPVVGNSLITESAQVVEASGDAAIVQANTILNETFAQVVDPSIPIVGNSLLNVTGGLAGNFTQGSVSFVANTLLAESAQVVDPVVPVVASSVLVESSAQVVDPVVPVVASSQIAESAQIVAQGDILAASSILSGTGTILGLSIAGDVMLAAYALQTVTLAATAVATVSLNAVAVASEVLAAVAP
jgi:hypothetical protein